MSEILLGQAPQSNARRDAIHIAVAPVIAAMSMQPGTHCGPAGDGKFDPRETPIGIVDPFLKEAVPTGGSFWLFMYPKTVTDLRHEWSHPAFSPVPVDKLPSEQYLRAIASELNASSNYAVNDPYEHMMKCAAAFIASGDPDEPTFETWDNIEDVADVATFWNHYEIVTGATVPVNMRGDFTGCCI